MNTEAVIVCGHRQGPRAHIVRRLAVERGCVVSHALRTDAAHDFSSDALHVVRHGRPERLIAEIPAEASLVETLGSFLDDDHTTVREVVCVVDAARFFDDLLDDEYYTVPGTRPCRYVARALRMVQQIELASALIVTGWEDVPTRDLAVLLALLSHLAPAAQIGLTRAERVGPQSRFDDHVHQPGWVHVLNDEHDPFMRDLRVQTFRYQQLRPFHPDRLHRVLDEQIGSGAFGAVLRSAGMCRIATRPGLSGSWEHVGQMISIDPLALDGHHDEPLALGQDIAFTGIDMDAVALSRALDAAALTDEELLAGPAAWLAYADPFPSWESAVH
ncbi:MULTISPECIES: GTP-binding protein [unclassified Microbacterium]|uniref:GTP-binding protein n=1 Tax=unclassified Microbacterium TaxID=2609290 RepID=UPI003423DC0E